MITRSTSAQCPASCGELLQGCLYGSEKLISCPVDWYSEVIVSNTPYYQKERTYMRLALQKTLTYLGIEQAAGNKLSLLVNSTIPIAKGMASSTADIVATIVATARWFDLSLSETEIATIAISIEPTDSTLFNQLTLFDHIQGQCYQTIGRIDNLDVLILEPITQLKTTDFHRQQRQRSQPTEEPLTHALTLLETGCRLNQPELVAQAATLSAIQRQKVLIKPLFEQLLSLLDRGYISGICCAHSGTVLGLLVKSGNYDADFIGAELLRKGITHYYPNQYWHKLISGGIK